MAEKNPKLAIYPGHPVTVTFEKAEPYSGEGQYGPWYLWTVYEGGAPKSLFANPTPGKTSPGYEQLAGALTHSLTVTIENNDNSNWAITPDGAPSAAPGNTPPPPQPRQAATAAPSPTRKPFKGLVDLTTRLLQEAGALAGGLPHEATNEDVRSLAVYLGIECNKRGITAESIKQEAGIADGDGDLPF